MSEVSQSDVVVAEGVQWWLEKEAGNSTFNQNKGLDELEGLRQTLVDKADPKVGGHISRMQKWLEAYPSIEDYTDTQRDELDSKVAFGALMFLSGAYRRQRYIQAQDQDDYYRRKLDWVHPGSIDIKNLFPALLLRDRSTILDPHDVVDAGHRAIDATDDAFSVIYANAPEDFGKEKSQSVGVIVDEQKAWLDFLSKSLINSSHRRGLDPRHVPILEPTTITHAEQTTFHDVLATRPS